MKHAKQIKAQMSTLLSLMHSRDVDMAGNERTLATGMYTALRWVLIENGHPLEDFLAFRIRKNKMSTK